MSRRSGEAFRLAARNESSEPACPHLVAARTLRIELVTGYAHALDDYGRVGAAGGRPGSWLNLTRFIAGHPVCECCDSALSTRVLALDRRRTWNCLLAICRGCMFILGADIVHAVPTDLQHLAEVGNGPTPENPTTRGTTDVQEVSARLRSRLRSRQ